MDHRTNRLVLRSMFPVCVVFAAWGGRAWAQTNLIQNGDFEAGNTGFQTSYTYAPVHTAPWQYMVGITPSAFDPTFVNPPASGNMLMTTSQGMLGATFWSQGVVLRGRRVYGLTFRYAPLTDGGSGVKVAVMDSGLTLSLGGQPGQWTTTHTSVALPFSWDSTTDPVARTLDIRGYWFSPQPAPLNFAFDDFSLVECFDASQPTVTPGTLYPGDTLTMHFPTTCTDCQYQWYQVCSSPLIVTDGINSQGNVVSGSTTATLTISNLAPWQNSCYGYYCFAWNACGGMQSPDVAWSVGGCDRVDFNGDTVFPDTQDIADFLLVFGGGACPTAACGDIDFNNDGLFPDTRDIDALLSVFAGGECT